VDLDHLRHHGDMAREDDPASGFRAVDEQDARKFIAYLDEQARSPFWRARKRETVEAMRLPPGGAGLDVGCGLGDEVRAIAEHGGRAVGVDSSEALIAEARRRSDHEFLVADAHELPFEDGTFDGVRVERTLQHVEDPAKVVAEMLRVTRPGGRVVAIEPDWDTLVIDARPLEATRRVTRAWADGIRHADIGRRLGGLLGTADVEPRTWVIDSFETAEQQFELSSLGDEEWLAALRDRPFLAAVTYFLVTATR
jgi:ubiquinone/menaquinone biosynthesis C-methylase UbiE